MKPTLYILAGPTAVGKTELSIKLAKRINGEVISADSIQVYRQMDIGSAKIRPEEMQGVSHHLIDILDPIEPFDVVLFQKLAKDAIAEIRERGNNPLVVGGTGFYLHALIYDNDFSDGATDPLYRSELENEALNPENDLYTRLGEVDPAAQEAIPKGNVKRVIRALEYYHVTGMRISDHNREERERESPYDFKFFVLTLPRDILYERINNRVEIMVKEGLFEETEKLISLGVKPQMTSMQGLGYKEMIPCVRGECAPEEAAERIRTGTRHYAKRQMTFLRREEKIRYVNTESPDAYDEIRRILE